ncbi:MAG: helix-hairpin-helix domain-containing protein [Erysipelotrichaceae bacterium]|jgi:competence protein ComEA|nr:helix-hairpin-helix domain-containing protein [Erysipelotrichaceae bacterium]
MFKIIIAIVALTIVGIVVLLAVDPNQATPLEPLTEVSLASVTIEGEVMRQGSYPYKENYTLGNLINDAGGITTNADELAFFYDLALSKGTTYYIAPKYDVNDVCGDAPIVKVNVNADSATDLATINGISSSIASAIVSYRASNRIDSLEELIEVKGIGSATYNKVRNYVILHV